MKNVLKSVFDVVFSFGTFVAVAFGLVVLIFINVLNEENAANALAKATTQACYDNGMIKVNTDAGAYCVDPANLVKVK